MNEGLLVLTDSTLLCTLYWLLLGHGTPAPSLPQMLIRVASSATVVAVFIGVLYFVAAVLRPPSDYLPYFENNDDWKK